MLSLMLAALSLVVLPAGHVELPLAASPTLDPCPGRVLDVATGELNGDGVPDLVCGSTVDGAGRVSVIPGNPEALFPRGSGSVHPFRGPVRAHPLSLRPDRVVTGDFDNDGRLDVAAAGLGDSALQVLFAPYGDGRARSELRALPGRVTELAAVDLGRRDGLADLVVALDGDAGPELLVFSGARGALRSPPERWTLDEIVRGVEARRLGEGAVHGLVLHGEEAGVDGGARRLEMRLNRDAVADYVAVRDGEASLLLSPAGATIVVDAALDGVAAGDGRCTLREAMLNANANVDTTAGDCAAGSGVDQIEFSIGGGGATAQIDILSALPAITEALVLDGTTQGCPAPPCIDLNGIPSLGANGLQLLSSDSVIRGLGIRGFDEHGIRVDAPGNVIEGCRIGTNLSGTGALPNFLAGIYLAASDTTIGGTAPGAGNLLSGNTDGISIDASSHDNRIQGNRIGTNAAGTASLQNDVWGMFVGSSSGNLIGGTTVGAGNLVSGNSLGGILFNGVGVVDNLLQGNIVGLDAAGNLLLPNGSAGVAFLNDCSGNTVGGPAAGAGNVLSGNGEFGLVLINGTTQTIVQGNRIGTDAGGSFDRGNTLSGIIVQNSTGNTIGGEAAGEGNLISGNSENGIYLLFAGGPADDNLIAGNRIGTDATGALPLGNSQSGILIEGGSNNVLGPGNRIAHNGLRGVDVRGASSGNEITANSIVENGLLGIDLNSDGVTANDLLDLDGGPNLLQNYPRLTAVSATRATLSVTADFGAAADTTYRVELFAGSACDASGRGEGERFVGSFETTTNGSGLTSINEAVAGSVMDGEIVTSTATDPSGNTSEFSGCATASCTGFVTFDPSIEALDRESFGWPLPEDVRFVRGPLGGLSVYATLEEGMLLGSTTWSIGSAVPAAGDGWYYLVQPLGCGSWQSSPGAEPDRDLSLP
jgi:hypothetical protein